MGAMYLLRNLIVLEPAMNPLETATNVLNELHRMKSLKGVPFITINRAIRIQRRVINKINK